jgi:PAS domain S-box-containing protein
LSSDLICIADSVYVRRVNAAFERTLGYSRQEVLSRPLVDFVHPADRDLALDALDQLSDGDGPVHLEDRCICKDGSVRWLEWNVVSDQGLIYLAGRDVTEGRRQQDELGVLAEQQAALRRVATLVARAVSPPDVFSAVAIELARCLGVCHATLLRYEADGAVSNAICTTAPNSGWSHSGSSRVARRRQCHPDFTRSTSRFLTSLAV